ncbi:MAG: KOW domain-containing RNA-binding protein [Lachnospiraceae bacterium]|nr:KOW domain-containing RNA-binding protein [Lachnospiraceae bacterium]
MESKDRVSPAGTDGIEGRGTAGRIRVEAAKARQFMNNGGIKLARSKAGHDKGQYYVILREDGDSVYLADGISRTVENPKRKNQKHIQVIRNIPEEVSVLLSGDTPGDLEIKRALKLYIRDTES